jgi:hypothetical protein
MRKQLLFCTLLGTMAACQQETDIQPNSLTLADEAVGTYRTNFYLDPSCVNTPVDRMPVTELRAESDSSVTLVYTKLYPAKTNQSLEHVALSRQATGIQLRLAGSVIGTLEADRVFTNNGMEKQGKLLRLNLPDTGKNSLTFAGAR